MKHVREPFDPFHNWLVNRDGDDRYQYYSAQTMFLLWYEFCRETAKPLSRIQKKRARKRACSCGRGYWVHSTMSGGFISQVCLTCGRTEFPSMFPVR
jgi:hypothetical protein